MSRRRRPVVWGHHSAKGPVSRILSCAVIPLGAASPRTLISDLPGGFDAFRSRLNASGRCAAPLSSQRPLPSLFGLAPCGVYHAFALADEAVRSYRTFSPLPGLALRSIRRYLLCGTGRLQALTPESRTLSGTLSCGVRTFLSRHPPKRAPAATARSSCLS